MQRASVRFHSLPIIALAYCALTRPASAHLVSSGIGPYYDGIAHFFVSPDDLIVVIALAIFGGLTGKPAARLLVLALPAAWLLGAALGMLLPGPTGSGWMPAISMLLAGLLAAANPKLPVQLPAIIAALLGLLHGFLNGRAMAMTDTTFLAAIGIVTGAAIVALLLSALTSSLRVAWQRIACRALGSWAAAVGLLFLAWNLRPM